MTSIRTKYLSHGPHTEQDKTPSYVCVAYACVARATNRRRNCMAINMPCCCVEQSARCTTVRRRCGRRIVFHAVTTMLVGLEIGAAVCRAA